MYPFAWTPPEEINAQIHGYSWRQEPALALSAYSNFTIFVDVIMVSHNKQQHHITHGECDGTNGYASMQKMPQHQPALDITPSQKEVQGELSSARPAPKSS